MAVTASADIDQNVLFADRALNGGLRMKQPFTWRKAVWQQCAAASALLADSPRARKPAVCSPSPLHRNKLTKGAHLVVVRPMHMLLRVALEPKQSIVAHADVWVSLLLERRRAAFADHCPDRLEVVFPCQV